MKFSQLAKTSRLNEAYVPDYIESYIDDIKSHMSIIANQRGRKDLYLYAFRTALDALDLCIELVEEKGLYAELEKSKKRIFEDLKDRMDIINTTILKNK